MFILSLLKSWCDYLVDSVIKKIQKTTIFIFIYNKVAALQVPLILTIA